LPATGKLEANITFISADVKISMSVANIFDILQGNGDETKNSTTRCGCKAMMRVATNESCKWYMKKIIVEHNHDMVESCGEKKFGFT
jgi:hypothetical protein